MRIRFITIAVPLVLIFAGWSAALYIATNVRTECASDTGWSTLTGQNICTAPIAYQVTHPTPWWGFNHVFGPVLLIALAVVPVVGAILFEIRLLRANRDTATTVSS